MQEGRRKTERIEVFFSCIPAFLIHHQSWPGLLEMSQGLATHVALVVR